MDEAEIIKYALRFEKDLLGLTKAYSELELLIGREHDAVGRSDLDALALMLKDKESLGERVVTSTERLLALGHEVLTISRHKGVNLQWQGSLKEFFLLLRSLVSLPPKQGLESKVLSHLFDKLARDLESFFKVFKEVKPRVEQNKYLVGRLLERHRQNIRIWQETLAMSESIYNEAGISGSHHHRSVISVKA